MRKTKASRRAKRLIRRLEKMTRSKNWDIKRMFWAMRKIKKERIGLYNLRLDKVENLLRELKENQ